MTAYKSDLFFGSLTGNGRVLVVDDEPDIRRVVRMMLEKAGYDVLEAEDGQAAIEVINTGENRLMLDAVVCDMRMPKINGVVAMAYLSRSIPPCPSGRADGLSRYGDGRLVLMRRASVDYLVKPVDGEQLRSAVSRAMAQREIAWR